MSYSTSRQIFGSLAADIHTAPPASRPGAFASQASSDTVAASMHFSGGAEYSKKHPNAICVTSVPTAGTIMDFCQAASDFNIGGQSSCAWNGSYMVPYDSSQLPADGKIKTCDQTTNPNEVCVYPGSVPIMCSADSGNAINVDNGQATLIPSWIAVPKSEADLVMSQYASCYAGKPNHQKDKYAYTETTNFNVAYSNPFQTIGRQ